MPKLAAWGPSGLPYFSQFSRDSSSVSLWGKSSTNGLHQIDNQVSRRIYSLRLIGLGNPHKLLLVATLLVRMVHLAQPAILLPDLCHRCTLQVQEEGDQKDGEGKDGEGKDGEGKDGEGEDGEGKDGEGKDGEGEDGEGEDGEGEDGEGEDGEGKDGEGKDGEGKDGEGKDGEGKMGRGRMGRGRMGRGRMGRGRMGRGRMGRGRMGRGRMGRGRMGRGRMGREAQVKQPLAYLSTKSMTYSVQLQNAVGVVLRVLPLHGEHFVGHHQQHTPQDHQHHHPEAQWKGLLHTSPRRVRAGLKPI